MPKDTAHPISAAAQTVTFETEDGVELVGQLYTPPHPPFAIVVLCGATGVPQGYYTHFATWLAEERGLAVLTFDYRDMGRSARGHVRRSSANMADWAIPDAEAARAHAGRLFPDVPLWVIGHSLGTFLLPAQKNVGQIARIIGVATGWVHYTDHPWPYRAIVLMFWFGLGPLLTRLLGYMPGKLLGFGADMPAGVYWQWRKWCTTRDSYRRDIGRNLPGWNSGNLPEQTRFFSLADDEMTPSICTMRLARAYNLAPHTVIDPKKHGLARVGHLAFFARRNKVLWPLIFET